MTVIPGRPLPFQPVVSISNPRLPTRFGSVTVTLLDAVENFPAVSVTVTVTVNEPGFG